MIEIIPNWHPIFVHFTVTLLVITGVLQILQWMLSDKLNKPSILTTQKWLVILSTLAIVLTLATGLQAYYSVNHDTPSHLAMTSHRNWALLTGLIFLLGAVSYFLNPKTKSSLSGGLFVIAFLLLSATAYKGGELVYRYGLGVLSLPVVTGDGHDHDHGTADAHSPPPINTNNSANDDHNNHDYEAEEQTTMTEVQQDDHEHETQATVEAPTEVLQQPSEHDHSEGQAKDHHSQDSIELMTGLDSPAAETVIAFHKAITSGNGSEARTYLEDAIVIFEGGGVERSADQYASHHMISDMLFLKELNITNLEHQVKVDGNMAVSISRSHMQGTFKGKKIDIKSMESMVLKKINDQWKIIHIHWSN